MLKLPRKFYNRPTIDVAIDLLGCHIICKTDGIKTGGKIVETEAYIGEDDPACHAFHGLTNRNRIMYGPPGFLYVYFTYGNHHMMNVVTEDEGYPAAVLIRAIEPLYGISEMARRRSVENHVDIASGPGKAAAALGVTRNENGTDLTGSVIYLSGPSSRVKGEVMASPRIGIGNRGKEKLWRFYLKDNPHVSRPPGTVREYCMAISVAGKSGFVLKKTSKVR